MKGWIALPRDIEHHWLWMNPRYFQMWVKMLFLCQWEDGAVMIGKNRVEVKKGQFATTMRILSSQFHCGKQCTMDFLKTLEEGDLIKKEVFSKYTLITVLDYMEMKPMRGMKSGGESRSKAPPHDRKNDRKAAHIKESNNKEDSSSSSSRADFENIFQTLREDEEMWSVIAQDRKGSIDELRASAEEFFRERLLKLDTPPDFQAIKNHLVNWLRKSEEINATKKKTRKPPNQDNNGTTHTDRRRGVDEPPTPSQGVKKGRF